MSCENNNPPYVNTTFKFFGIPRRRGWRWRGRRMQTNIEMVWNGLVAGVLPVTKRIRWPQIASSDALFQTYSQMPRKPDSCRILLPRSSFAASKMNERLFALVAVSGWCFPKSFSFSSRARRLISSAALNPPFDISTDAKLSALRRVSGFSLPNTSSRPLSALLFISSASSSLHKSWYTKASWLTFSFHQTRALSTRVPICSSLALTHTSVSLEQWCSYWPGCVGETCLALSLLASMSAQVSLRHFLTFPGAKGSLPRQTLQTKCQGDLFLRHSLSLLYFVDISLLPRHICLDQEGLNRLQPKLLGH